MPRRLASYLALAALLGVVAVFASNLRLPDTFFYTGAAERTITPGCAEIHCFRVLVPWVLGALPGPALLRWKAYGVLANAAAALAVFDLCLVFGLSRRASAIAAALSGFGWGSFYTLFEPYTSDPLMFWLSPLVLRWALEERFVRAGLTASIGVFAKEFVVVPLVIVAVAEGAARHWARASRAIAAALVAFAVWVALNAWLRTAFGYTYGPNRSPDLLGGSYLFFWLSQMSPRGALSAIFNQFGATYLLIPFGWRAAPPRLKPIVLAALPFAAAFAYVQQPDRAWWNFHFLTSPLAALVLEPMPDWFVGLFLSIYALANLKVGAQVSWAPQARYAFAAGLVLAAIAVVQAWRARTEPARA